MRNNNIRPLKTSHAKVNIGACDLFDMNMNDTP